MDDDFGLDSREASSSDLFFDDEGLDDDPDDGHFGFQEVTSEKEKQKPYETDFSVVEPATLKARQTQAATQLNTLLGIPLSQAPLLLRQFRWNQDRLIDRYMEDADAFYASANLPPPSAKAEESVQTLKNFTCEICYMSDPETKTFGLACNHRYCFDCYSRYVTSKVMGEADWRVQCMAKKCQMRMDDQQILELLPKQHVHRFERLINQNYLDDHEFLKWCPSPDCKFAVECHVLNSSLSRVVPSVRCTCGYSFCFGCLLENHQPAICSIVKLWLKKCADDSETANWISANTKECPKCHSTIEKNGGCNHMQCKGCKNDFCWVCLGPWQDHGTSWYNCNRFDDKVSEDARSAQAKSRAQLDRYLHYFTRYDNHHSSAKLEQELYQKIEKKMEEMQKNSELSWIEVQFLRKAADVLFKCRMILKWTYSFAYYLQRDNNTVIFEDNQRDLEMAVEFLSELLESPIDTSTILDLKQKVLDKTVYVSSRMEILLTDCAQGLQEDRWKYITDVPLF